MNKKNISLILAGIMLLVLEFTIKIGAVRIDIFSDIIAFILIILGIRELVPRNVLFKKSRNVSFMGLIAVVIGQALLCMDWGDINSEISTIAAGLSTVFTIYFTYYYTEAIILEAKFQEKSAATRSFRMTWLILGAMIFVNYIAFMSNISIASILTKAITVICTIYYCSSMLTACRQLYMDGLPTKHMQVSDK